MQVRTLQRWRSEPAAGDRRPERLQQPANKLDDLERQRILAVANSAEFGHLPASQIVPRLAETRAATWRPNRRSIGFSPQQT